MNWPYKIQEKFYQALLFLFVPSSSLSLLLAKGCNCIFGICTYHFFLHAFQNANRAKKNCPIPSISSNWKASDYTTFLTILKQRNKNKGEHNLTTCLFPKENNLMNQAHIQGHWNIGHEQEEDRQLHFGRTPTMEFWRAFPFIIWRIKIFHCC